MRLEMLFVITVLGEISANVHLTDTDSENITEINLNTIESDQALIEIETVTPIIKDTGPKNLTNIDLNITESGQSPIEVETLTPILTGFKLNSTEDNVSSTTEFPFPYPNTICKLCDCLNGTIDCTERDIRRPFTLWDWKGLDISDPTDVDLSKNPLIAISEISELPIRKLNFSHCLIQVIDDACFVHLKDLSSLDFSYNKLSAFALSRKVFAGILVPRQRPQQFMKMRYLSLAYNNIHSLAQDLFTFMTALTYLDLSGNPLTTIDQVTMGAISDLLYLKELKLSNCDLETIPEGMFRRLPKLERLDISGNRFASVPAVLGEAVNLKYLNFDNNLLEVFDKKTAISSLKKLDELHLSYNRKLKSIGSGVLGGLERLTILHISYNVRLSEIDPAFLVWEDELNNERRPYIKELYLHKNNITEINSKILEYWDHVTMMDFTNNPYICDCNNQWMVDFLTPLVIRTAGNLKANKMICRKPQTLSGTTFVELYQDKTQLECENSDGVLNAAEPNLFLLFGIVIGVFATFPLVLIVVLLWRRGYFRKYRENVVHIQWDEEGETDNF